MVPRETLTFDIADMGRMAGGDFIDAEGTEHKWDHEDVYGGLCSDCAGPAIEALNAALK